MNPAVFTIHRGDVDVIHALVRRNLNRRIFAKSAGIKIDHTILAGIFQGSKF